jgi:hypothetical protein
MPVDLREQAGGKLLAVELSGKLAKQDYEQFVPEVERLIRQHGKLRLVVELKDFHGWELGALWEDIKFDLKHFRDIERLALVGETRWEKGMAAFCKPFTTAEIRYFDKADRDKAYAWIQSGLVSATA